MIPGGASDGLPLNCRAAPRMPVSCAYLGRNCSRFGLIWMGDSRVDSAKPIGRTSAWEIRTESSHSSRSVTVLGSWDKSLLESDGLPTAAFLHVDPREHNLALGIFSRHRSCDIGLTGNHRGVAIHAHLHIGNLIRAIIYLTRPRVEQIMALAGVLLAKARDALPSAIPIHRNGSVHA